MDTTLNTLLTLLRSSLNRQAPCLPKTDEKSWEKVYWAARSHGIVAIVNDAIELLPPEQQPQGDIALSWALSAERTRHHYHRQEETLSNIREKAESIGLDYVTFKGLALARYYPVPDSRACGDIDIYFLGPNGYKEGNAFLGDPEAGKDGKHSEIEVNGVIFENHQHFLDLNYRSQKRAESYLVKSLSQSINHLLPPMADMVYNLMHTVGHLTAKYKLPLRNIVDWGMFLKGNIGILDPKECQQITKKIGMNQSFDILTKLASEIIGFDLSAYIGGHIRQRDLDNLRELILNKEYFSAVPQNLSRWQKLRTRIQRNRQRRWLYRYLPSTRSERLRYISKQI